MPNEIKARYVMIVFCEIWDKGNSRLKKKLTVKLGTGVQAPPPFKTDEVIELLGYYGDQGWVVKGQTQTDARVLDHRPSGSWQTLSEITYLLEKVTPRT